MKLTLEIEDQQIKDIIINSLKATNPEVAKVITTENITLLCKTQEGNVPCHGLTIFIEKN